MEMIAECCENDYSLLDFSKMELPGWYIHLLNTELWFAAACIAFNPLFWNIVARWEYRTRNLTNLFDSPYFGCYLLAVAILILGIFRDWRFSLALASQPKWPFLFQNWILWSGYGLVMVGMILVLTSFMALGFTGTFLGDYFGILMTEKVTSFPFNIMENPMYWGSTMNFLGLALIQASQAGILLSVWVAVCYKIALTYEGPFTEAIYAAKDNQKTK